MNDSSFDCRQRGVTAAKRLPIHGLTIFAALLLAGCSSPPFGAATPEYDRHFGESVRAGARGPDPRSGRRSRNLGKTTEMDGDRL